MGLALGLLAVMAGLLAASETAAQAVREGLALCGGSVIPALFPFLVVSRLFVATGSAAVLGRLLAPLTRRMLGISGPGGTAVLLGLLGGYPVGAQTAGELARTGAISRQEGQRLLLFCNNCGPAFALGVAGVGCFGSLRAGAWLWLIHVGRCADGSADPSHLVPGGTDFAVCAAGSGFRFSGGRPGSGGGDAPRLRLRGVLSGADPAADSPDGAGAPSSAGTAGTYRRHPAALRHTGGLRAGGGTDGLGRRVRPLSDGGGAGGERTPHEGLSVGKGSAGGSIGGIGCSRKPLGAVKGCCFPLWRTKNGTRIRHERLTKFLCRKFELLRVLTDLPHC